MLCAEGIIPNVKQLCAFGLLALTLWSAGCATQATGNQDIPPGGIIPTSDGATWEYRTVMLEGANMGDINAQLLRWNSQGWQAVNNYVNVRRGGLGYIASVPMRRAK